MAKYPHAFATKNALLNITILLQSDFTSAPCSAQPPFKVAGSSVQHVNASSWRNLLLRSTYVAASRTAARDLLCLSDRLISMLLDSAARSATQPGKCSTPHSPAGNHDIKAQRACSVSSTSTFARHHHLAASRSNAMCKATVGVPSVV